jgi:hypothetical protein
VALSRPRPPSLLPDSSFARKCRPPLPFPRPPIWEIIRDASVCVARAAGCPQKIPRIPRNSLPRPRYAR